MSEVTDIVVPILQRIQADLADVKRDVAELKRVQAEHTDKLDELEIYLAYATGLGSQTKADTQSGKSEIRVIKKRLDALETPS